MTAQQQMEITRIFRDQLPTLWGDALLLLWASDSSTDEDQKRLYAEAGYLAAAEAVYGSEAPIAVPTAHHLVRRLSLQIDDMGETCFEFLTVLITAASGDIGSRNALTHRLIEAGALPAGLKDVIAG